MRLVLLGVFFSLTFLAFAQEEEKKFDIQPIVHFRTFWMSTSYPDDFKNDFALGTSLAGGARAEIASYWQIEASYRGFLNVWSSEIWMPDPLTKSGNRYETGLFDLLNPDKNAFGSWELLSLQYKSPSFHAKVGRMEINTAWINGQDGRLSPTLVEGATIHWQIAPSWAINSWYIHRFRVRGTSKWLSPGETIGIFPVARDPEGNPSRYYGNTTSDAVSIVEIVKDSEVGKFQLSQTWAHQLFLTYDAEWKKSWVSKSGLNWNSGIQLGYQFGLGNGGNDNPELAYKDPTDKNWVISSRLGMKKGKFQTIISFTKLGGKGRWLSPREWGRDPWFTFIPRERNEGYQRLEALTIWTAFKPDKSWEIYAHLGFHWLPDVDDFKGNKYAFPSYRQLNLGAKFQPKSIKNLDFHLLIMNKEALGNPVLNPSQRYNKVEMIHLNLISNWRF